MTLNLLQKRDLLYFNHGCRYILRLPDDTELYAKTEAGATKAAQEKSAQVYELTVDDKGQITRLFAFTFEPTAVEDAPVLAVEEPVQEEPEDEPEAPENPIGAEDEEEAQLSSEGQVVTPDAHGAIIACNVNVHDVFRECFKVMGMDYDKNRPTLRVRFKTTAGSSGCAWVERKPHGHVALSLGYDADLAVLKELVLHESTHFPYHVYRRESRRKRSGVHGEAFKRGLCNAAYKLWGVRVDPLTKGRYGCDPLIIKALRAKGFTTPRDAGRKGGMTVVEARRAADRREQLYNARLTHILRQLGHEIKEFATFNVLTSKKGLWGRSVIKRFSWLMKSGKPGQKYYVEYVLKDGGRYEGAVIVPTETQLEAMLGW